MKLTIVAGDDTQRSRKRFGDIIGVIKKRDWDINWYDPSINQSITQLLGAGSLFEKPSLVVASDIKVISKDDFYWIRGNYERLDTNLLIYCVGKIPDGLKKNLPDTANIEQFDIPFLIYKFFDSLFPGNMPGYLTMLEEIGGAHPQEFIVAMLGRHLKDLYWSKQEKKPKLQAWRLSKLQKQADLIGEAGLKGLIMALSDFDFETKTGGSGSLELLLVKHLG